MLSNNSHWIQKVAGTGYHHPAPFGQLGRELSGDMGAIGGAGPGADHGHRA